MAMFNQLALSALTRNEEDAGTSSTLNVTVNVDGEDVLDRDFDFDLDDGEAYIRITSTLPTPFDSSGLTNSSIRVGIRDDDAWAPQHILLFGPAQPDFQPGRTIALAMETDLSHWLSIDPSEGHLTMPLRLVGPGDSTTQIRRVLLLVDTAWSALGPSGTGGNTGTDSDIELEIIAGGNLVLKQQIHDTSQPDLERGTTNWYFLDPAAPFTRGEVLSNGGIRLSILGSDAWRPQELFVFGLDTATGRPNNVVSLVSLPIWSEGWMSTDLTEGKPAVDLPVVSV